MKNLVYRVKKLENGNYLLEIDEALKNQIESYLGDKDVDESDRRYETASVKGCIPVVYAPSFVLRRALEVSAE